MVKLKRRLLSTSVQSLLITVVVILVLVLVGTPIAQAITISVSSGTGTLGSAYAFTVTINIEDTDLLPLKSVDINIYNADSPSIYTFTCTNLPVPTAASTTTATQSYTGTFGTASVSGISGANWVYATATRWGYGYGYQSGTTENITGLTGYGYGYGYNTNYVGATQLTYNVSWTSPSSWPAGTYYIRAIVYGNGTADKAFTNSTLGSISLSAAPAVVTTTYTAGPEAGPPGPPYEPGILDVSDIINEYGVFTEPTSIEIGPVELAIPEDTTGLTEEGEPLSEINVTEMAEPPAPPEDTNIIGLTYDLGPDGATFAPPITITFTYDEADIPEGVDEEDLVIAIWDEDAGEWVVLEDVTVDPVTNTISASVSHFTAFTILAYIPPVPVTAPPVAPPVPPVAPPAPPAPPVVVAPPPVVPAPPVIAPPPPVVPAPPVPVPTPWWIVIITAVATIIVVGVVLWFYEFRRV